MSSSWLLDIFGDSDLRSSTKLRHIGNVKSVIFIKKKQTSPSLCSIVNLPILHSLGFREHQQHCFFLYCSDLCCLFLLQKAENCLHIQPLLLCISLWKQQFCLQAPLLQVPGEQSSPYLSKTISAVEKLGVPAFLGAVA